MKSQRQCRREPLSGSKPEATSFGSNPTRQRLFLQLAQPVAPRSLHSRCLASLRYKVCSLTPCFWRRSGTGAAPLPTPSAPR